ncbi:hypothetical protein WA577_004371 [Blastocystis sp. JDR]
MESPQDSSAEERRRKSEQYEKEVQAFREESGLAREVQEEFKREALRKCNDLHKALLDCYEKKYFCGTVEKEFWDCYRKERGYKRSKVSAWAYRMHNRVSGQDDCSKENKNQNQ